MPIAYRACATDELGAAGLAQLLDLGHACWSDGDFTADDLDHALGGRHFLAEADGRLIAHASVVPRRLEMGGRPLRTGYVEAVATLPQFQRQGIASRLVAAASAYIAATYELGALSTGEHRFYERLGWRCWLGETWVRERDGALARTAGDDAGMMVLPTPTGPRLTLTGPLTCEWRPGDVW
jgi:aminoglycoside 2'-N-acetyltransferase I